MLANLAVPIMGTIVGWIVMIVIACVIIDLGSKINLDGGE